MLRTPDLFEINNVLDKVKIAIERIQMYEPPEGYYLAFSGGKDSQCIYHLAKAAGVKFEAHYHLTTVDPPELIWFIKRHYPDVIIDKPKETMWKLIVRNGCPPTQIIRYCCKELKEGNGSGRSVILGIRSQESFRRKNRQIIESCHKKASIHVHPIVDWSEHDVWEYHREIGIPHCCLYDEGRKRIGCVMCPNGRTKGMKADSARWPKLYAQYVRTFDRMLARKRELGKTINKNWNDGEAVMKWWMNL